MLCQYFKQGHCEKGKKCKFSHDPAVERKGEKKSLYQDTREQENEEKKKDEMAEWDEGEHWRRGRWVQEKLKASQPNSGKLF